MRKHEYRFLVALVLILSVLIIGLRGTSPQPIAYQVSGLQTATSVEGVAMGPMMWYDNFAGTDWQISPANTTKTSFTQSHALNMNVTFTAQPIPQAVTISRTLNLSLGRDPVVVTEINVSHGVHYGIRFSGVRPDDTNFEAWSENTPLQHRSGLGSEENITTDLQVQTYIANGQAPIAGSRITSLSLYLEATVGTSGTYSMKVTSIRVFPLEITPSSSLEAKGDLQGIAIKLHIPAIDQNLFQAYVDFNIQGTPSLHYTPFLMRGTVVLAQGFTYVRNVVTPYVSAVLTTTLISSYPSFFLDGNSTAIIITANAGSIGQFALVNLSFKYTSTPIQSAGFVDPSVVPPVLAYYFLFLFATPIAATILISRVFKAEG